MQVIIKDIASRTKYTTCYSIRSDLNNCDLVGDIEISNSK